MNHPPCTLDHVHAVDGHGCSTPVPAGFVDLRQTRYFEVGGNFYRTNHMAAPGFQVECQRLDEKWQTDGSYPTEWAFLNDVAGQWREVPESEVPGRG